MPRRGSLALSKLPALPPASFAGHVTLDCGFLTTRISSNR
jgi:hypothetical protein